MKEGRTMRAVKSKLVVDATGAGPIQNGVILLQNDKIIEVGSEGQVRIPSDSEVIDRGDETVLPGLIEPHQHFLAMDERPYAEKVKDPEAYKALWAARCAGEDLRSGVTSLRLLGSHGWWSFAFKKAIEDDVIAGPRILNAGRAVKAPQGHGYMGTPVSGIDDIRRIFRENFAMGADCAKIFISGGADSLTKPNFSYFTREEILAAVDEAHRFGAKIAAHADGGIGATWFVEAGGDSVEHGTALTDEQMELMVKKGTYLGMTNPGGLPPFNPGKSTAWMKKDDRLQANLAAKRKALIPAEEVLKKAIRKGVKFTTNQDISFGGIPWNIVSLVKKFGVSPLDAILANTRSAAECCGMLDKVGTLQGGKFADLISVRGNPLKDITDIQRISMVMKGGRIYDPERGSWEGMENRGFIR
jgi:imidazolonepropionase-like amidohydrolase